MKIEEAFSPDYGDMVDAEKAYDLFWSGEITDKRNFQCSENCIAQITCANLDKPRSRMKNILHFKIYGTHSPHCDIVTDKTKIGQSIETEGISTPRETYVDSEIDILLFERPKKDSEITSTNIKPTTRKITGGKSNVDNGTNTNAKRTPQYSTIKPLVSKFEKYCLNSTLGSHYINIKGNNVSYKSMFVNINNQDFGTLSKYLRIYHGEATIKKVKNTDDYRICFLNAINYQGQSYCPNIYISHSVIEKHYMRHHWKNILEELISMNSNIEFYVYSKAVVNKNYINFTMQNLDFLEFRTP